MDFRASRLAVVALALAAPFLVVPRTATAQASDPGFWTGAAVVWANFAGEHRGVALDDDTWSFKVNVGVDVLPYLGVELARTDLGEVEGREGTTLLSVDANTWACALVGQLPVSERFAVFGKAGYHIWQYEARLGDGARRLEKDDGGDPFVGLGVRWYLTEHLFLLGEYEAYRVHRFDYDNLNLGLGWKF
jgi:OOP family OmpA-OmpF porin